MEASFFCSKPFSDIEIHNEGNVFVCCPSWLNKPIGNIYKQSFHEIWNSEEAKAIRDSIHDGSYRFCDAKACPFISFGVPPRPIIENSTLNEIISTKKTELSTKPHMVLMANDLSCNLSCPSCRTEKISFPVGSEKLNQSLDVNKRIQEYFINSGDPFTLNITGSGDPFASIAYKTLLEELDGALYPQLKIELQTNGVLFNQKNWERLHKIQGNITRVFVSIDASSEKTYQIVRRGGHWKILMENMSFLRDLRQKNKITFLQANFIVQKENFREMPAFVDMCKKFGCDSISFSRINDWGCMGNGYQDAAVFFPENPLHEEFRKVLCDYRLKYHRVYLGNLLPLQRSAIEELKPKRTMRERIGSLIHLVLQRKFFLPRKIQRIFWR